MWLENDRAVCGFDDKFKEVSEYVEKNELYMLKLRKTK